MKKLKLGEDEINASESDYLYISLSQLPTSGKGLLTAINIYKGEIISLFKGEILTTVQATLRAKTGKNKYFINMSDGSIMDSMNVKCFAKYANDTKGTLNSKLRNNSKIGLDENNNVCLIATQNIKMNEEIFCSYGKKYWEKHR